MAAYSKQIDKALRISSWAHEKQGQHRKGSDVPYIVHPVGTMLVALEATQDESTLIACLLHDVLEDVDNQIYDDKKMEKDFGSKVLSIVKDVTKDDSIKDWYQRSKAYLDHIKNEACEEAVIVCASDKINNLSSVLIDYTVVGDDIWKIFTTKNSEDQVWWYESVLEVVKSRNCPSILVERLSSQINDLKKILN